MDEPDISIIGDDPLRDGMHLSVRFRYDFTVTDAERMLAAARRAYLEVHPGATPQDAAVQVTCAADAIFTLLERAGVLQDAPLAGYEADGVATGGSRAQAVMDEPAPLRAGWDCLRPDQADVFALPPPTVH